MFRKREFEQPRFRHVREDRLRSIIRKAEELYPKGECLDIGCGSSINGGYTTVDIRPEFDIRNEEGKVVAKVKPDLCVDARVWFASGYMDNPQLLEQYPDKDKIKPERWQLIKLSHFIEHIPWIHGEMMFRWVHGLLADGGMVWIATPNFEYITRVYIKNRELQKRGLGVRYPRAEHPFLRDGVQYDMQRWANFKFMSGGSPGDHHMSMWDEYMLASTLEYTGFSDIRMASGPVIHCCAYKPTGITSDTEEAVRRAMGDA